MISLRSSILAGFSGCFLFNPTASAEPAKNGQASPVPDASAAEPVKALLIAGGCCHDYAQQHKIISKGLQDRANIRVDVIWTPDKSVDPPFDFFKNADWAKGYDVIIHDECAAGNKDPEVIANILNTHKTLPAVQLHCAMHSYRVKEWAQHIGLLSTRHGPHVPLTVEIVDQEHPITKGMKGWVTGKEELYNNAEVHDAHPLAMGTQTYNKGGKQVTDSAIVAWVNTKHGAPSFSTSMGHYNEVVQSEEYLNLITRGTLWACGKLDKPAYMTAYPGANTIKEIPAKPVKKKPKKVKAPPKAPAKAQTKG